MLQLYQLLQAYPPMKPSLHGTPLPSIAALFVVRRKGILSRNGLSGSAHAHADGRKFPLSHSLFSLYDLFMVTDEQIQKWADEAEAGYDVEELKRRGRGRPGRGAEPMQVIAVRLTAEEVAALDELAEREHLSRSEAIRRALVDSAA